MYRVIPEQPHDRTITIEECKDRAGRKYKHAFIGCYAVSQRLEKILATEFRTYCRDGEIIPDLFYQHYNLVEVFPSRDDEDPRHYVTSNLWYTCQPKPIDLGFEL